MAHELSLPVLPLRDVVVFRWMVIPLFVGRERSIKALEVAMANSKQVLLAAQRCAADDEPEEDDIYMVGTVANILQLLKLPDGTVKVLVEGVHRAQMSEILLMEENYFLAKIDVWDEAGEEDKDAVVMARSLVTQFEQYVKLNKKIPTEILSTLSSIDDPSRLADTIAAHISLKIEDKQKLLEMKDLRQRIDCLMGLIESEIDILQVEKRIRGRVKRQMEKSQREYYLNEQMKAIQKELGELEDAPNELEELENKIKKSGMPQEVAKKATSELNKLRMMSPMSAEATVSRNYLDWMVSLPWKKRSKVANDLVAAEGVLEEDHYGLEKVKERILEYLAVQSRVKKLVGPVLCLVGPPGVGKTSLGQSIARATGRKYVRISLGGVRDEAEIRGHRRTYIGSMPGKIIQKIAKVGVKNPLILLDEIDKMSMDFRGDPASALLEVLDPEQNSTFSDHYLEVDYNLSDVMFVCTANSSSAIPTPLLDRMEEIRLSGYTEDEKVNIAIRHLIPKQLLRNGVQPEELSIEDDALRAIIRCYTREAGVRNLEREISKICRKVVKNALAAAKQDAKKKQPAAPEQVVVTADNIGDFLGVERYHFGMADQHNQIGQVTGLAWTEVGGEILRIETACMKGKGKITCTGHLGNVMQESIQAALTVARARAKMLGIVHDFYDETDIHVHVPEGATPKDGPSAGIGMCTALVSSLTRIPVRADVAMTGEITLRGEVLVIGGLKEKLLAAHRGGIKIVIIPEENRRELKELPENILTDLDIRPVKWIDEVFEIALESAPTPTPDDEDVDDVTSPPPKDKGCGDEVGAH